MLRELIRKKEETLFFPKGEVVTVHIILKKLSEKYGKVFVEYVYDSRTGEPRGFLQFLVNGRNISSKELDEELVDGDALAIIPPVGGG